MPTIYRDNTLPVNEKGAAYTVVPSDHGKVLLQTSATAGFTLPAVANVWDGWNVEILNLGATSLVITAPSGKMIGVNNAAGTTATFSTAGKIIGAGARVLYCGTQGKYFVHGLGECALVMS